MAGVWTNNLEGFLRAKALGYAAPGYATVYNRSGNAVTSPNPGASVYNHDFLATKITGLEVKTSTGTPSDGGVLSADGTHIGIRFGSGSTAPSATDYNLASSITTALTVVSVSNGQYVFANGVGTRTITITVQNQGATTRTIAEWGIEGYLYYFTSSSSSSYVSQYILLYRDVLDTPVTLAQYESATFTVTLELTMAAES